MKFLALFALCLATVSAEALYHREATMPVVGGPSGRIVGGQVATTGQFPYQAGLSLTVKGGTAWCGGSLISNTYVLTAAHCTDGVTSVNVILGATNRNAPQYSKTVNANAITIHANWNPTTLKNDISLIKIPTVAYSNVIAAASLAPNNGDLYVGTTAVASGWGRTSDTTNFVAVELHYAPMKVITNSECAATYGSLIVKEGQICVSTKDGSGTCNGDSGGPLVVENSSLQIGLTSFGSSAGCQKGYPAAFTRISYYYDWIIANSK